MEETLGGSPPGRVGSGPTAVADPSTNGSTWRLGIPFVLLHVACLAVLFVGVSPVAVVIAALSYTTRMIGITAFYHRCFSHRAFRVGRGVQLVGASLGAAAAQRGPLWWVAHHRIHHRYTDRPGDPHSPVVLGFWRSHVLWIFAPANRETALSRVPDLARFPELRVLDRFHHLTPAVWALGCVGLGAGLAAADPGLHTSAGQILVWGFVLPTVVLYHATFAVNSVAHRFGRRRFDTPDESRNNWVVAALTLGEGWHNNHHRFPSAARQGLGRFEADPTWWAVRALETLHLARGVRRAPALAWAAARGQPEEASDLGPVVVGAPRPGQADGPGERPGGRRSHRRAGSRRRAATVGVAERGGLRDPRGA